MVQDKKPMSPGRCALFAWLGVLVIGGAVSFAVVGNGPDSTARMERAGQGVGGFSFVVAAACYVAARSRVKAWERRQAADTRPPAAERPRRRSPTA